MTTPEDPNQPYGAPPPGSVPPPQPYGAPPPGSMPPPQPYAAPPPAYGGAPQQFGAPPQQFGAPPPTYGGAPGYVPASYGGAQLAHWGWRVLGYLIDLVIVAIPAAILGGVTGSRIVADLVGGIGGLALGYLNGAQGQTPGKRVVGIKVLRESDGQLIGGGMGIVRAIVHILDAIPCYIGFLWPLWDAKKQTFADKIVGTVVIKL
jgi:uncharacterized RDD family membrane protein YckC